MCRAIDQPPRAIDLMFKAFTLTCAAGPPRGGGWNFNYNPLSPLTKRTGLDSPSDQRVV
jgi:hypothetical protein